MSAPLSSTTSPTSQSPTVRILHDKPASANLATSFHDGEDVVLPVLKYGYRQSPLQWDELRQIIRVEKDMDKLTRSRPQQLHYELYKRQLRQNWKSIYDYILVHKFGAEKALKDKLWYAIPQNPVVSDKTALVLARNDFSYCMESNIEHWILWKRPGTCTNQDIACAKAELAQQYARQAVEFLHWINPPHLQSLPDIDHVHILCHIVE